MVRGGPETEWQIRTEFGRFSTRLHPYLRDACKANEDTAVRTVTPAHPPTVCHHPPSHLHPPLPPLHVAWWLLASLATAVPKGVPNWGVMKHVPAPGRMPVPGTPTPGTNPGTTPTPGVTPGTPATPGTPPGTPPTPAPVERGGEAAWG